MSKRFAISSILKLAQSRLVRGSLVMLAGTMVANAGNYLYHLLMGRMLGPKGYGELESAIAIIYLLFIAISTLTLVITKFTAYLKGKKDLKGVAYLYRFFSRRLFLFGSLIVLLLLLAGRAVASFLHFESAVPLVIVSFFFLVSILAMANRAILQGLLRFKDVVSVNISETVLKVIIASFLVYLGLGVNGAVLALFLAGYLAYLFSLYFLRSLKRILPQKPALSKKMFINFAVPVFFSNLSFVSLYTTDILLVKRFFSSHKAGLYASLAVLGKIVFFASSAITLVMFPIVTNRRSQGKSYRHLFLASFGLVLLICLGVETIYFIFPDLMVSLLFGSDYLEIVPLLGWMGLFISFYALSFLLINFFLSVDRVKIVILPLIASLGQIVLIVFFHTSLFQVIKISIGSCGLLLVSLMLYYGYGQIKTSFRYRSRL